MVKSNPALSTALIAALLLAGWQTANAQQRKPLRRTTTPVGSYLN